MRVNAGPDAARTWLHASTLRLDIGGTFLWDRCHCACCREQHDGTDRKNILQHKSVPQIFAFTKELGRDGLQRRPLHAPKLTQIICLGKVTAKVGPMSNQFLELNW